MTNLPSTFAIFGMPGHWELIMLAMIGVLLFGKRLPEIGRSLGKTFVEFKKGIHGLQHEIDQATYESHDTSYNTPNLVDQQPTAPKFEPPTDDTEAAADDYHADDDYDAGDEPASSDEASDAEAAPQSAPPSFTD